MTQALVTDFSSCWSILVWHRQSLMKWHLWSQGYFMGWDNAIQACFLGLASIIDYWFLDCCLDVLAITHVFTGRSQLGSRHTNLAPSPRVAFGFRASSLFTGCVNCHHIYSESPPSTDMADLDFVFGISCNFKSRKILCPSPWGNERFQDQLHRRPHLIFTNHFFVFWKCSKKCLTSFRKLGSQGR